MGRWISRAILRTLEKLLTGDQVCGVLSLSAVASGLVEWLRKFTTLNTIQSGQARTAMTRG